ncbi:FYN-binding protein 1-like [Xyrichtys novacula]|uniref:FYN-binding protein 1-like n=1 Tax=Xyrichtys novacula TaxID=13765 RepID=A0AAV1G5N8_XYRNO|nr:FYN-binding protein 1-like [Xyrichtys novacula]
MLALMYRPNSSQRSVKDAALKQQPVSSVQDRIASLEGRLSAAVNTSRSSSALTPMIRPTPSLRTTSLQPSTGKEALFSQFTKDSARKTAWRENSEVFSRASVARLSAKPVWTSFRGPGPTAPLKPETKTGPSFPTVQQRTKLPVAQKGCETTELRVTYSKPPELHQRQNKVHKSKPFTPKRRLPDVSALGRPPAKPCRPPSDVMHQIRKTFPSLSTESGTKTPRTAAPPLPLRPCPGPPSDHAADLLDGDESYDDICTLNPPPLPKDALRGSIKRNIRNQEAHQWLTQEMEKYNCRNKFLQVEKSLVSVQSEGVMDEYDDIGALADVCRVPPLPQKTSDGDENVYEVPYSAPPLMNRLCL